MTQAKTLYEQYRHQKAQVEEWYIQLRAADCSEIANLSALIANGEANMHQLWHAYQRALDGQQQFCENCDKPINPERLEAAPNATLCIHCAMQLNKQGFWIQAIPPAGRYAARLVAA